MLQRVWLAAEQVQPSLPAKILMTNSFSNQLVAKFHAICMSGSLAQVVGFIPFSSLTLAVPVSPGDSRARQ